MSTAGSTRLAGRILLAALATLSIMAALGAKQAQAANSSLLGCGQEVTHPFLRFLDPLPYTLAPDGGFEGDAAGWKLSGGAKVVSGNEPFTLSGPGTKSLTIPSGGSATSPPMCVGLVLPVVRFVYIGGSLLSTLKVEAVYTNAFGGQSAVELPLVLPSGSWQPTLQLLQLGGTLNALTLNGATTQMSFRFTPRGDLFGSGTWRIDDVYVDPWKNI